MKQKLFLFVFLILLVGLLVGLNAASYTQKEKAPDSEIQPNRSTFNAGATGTQAFYTLLFETGRKVARWQEAPAALLTSKLNKPAVFVVTGTLRRDFTPAETDDLLKWVSRGGRLVVVDREPLEGLLTTSANWKLTIKPSDNEASIYSVDPTEQAQMTHDTVAVKPVQPTLFTQRVNAIQPSKFAASIEFERFQRAEKPAGQGGGIGTGDAPPPPKARPTPSILRNDDDSDLLGNNNSTSDSASKQKPKMMNQRPYAIQTPAPIALTKLDIDDDVEPPSDAAPTVHFASGDRNLLVDVPYGGGRIVYMSDPYIVSNGGIGLVDNAQAAINLVAAGDGLVVFDEYHQGYGTDNNRFLQFFAGTPVVAIFLQAVLLIGFVFFSQSRRFARAVPGQEPDRLSKLEYVAAMAELQQRTRAFDLAIENVYTEFRRRVTRLLGLDNFASKSGEMAQAIAERTGLDRDKVEDTLFKCEDIIRGEPTNKREVVELTTALRELETKLGIKRAAKTKI